MISQKTIADISKADGVSWMTVEKDYFLTLLLEGIAADQTLGNAMVFKGGTALRKIYFQNYRYSEDLDFTLLQPVSEAEFTTGLESVFAYLKKQHNADFSIKSLYKRNWFADAKVQYLGLKGQKNTITIDVSGDETVVETPKKRRVFNPYYEKQFKIPAYSLEEITAEKLRALLQRTRVRDYYDCWHLLCKAKPAPGLKKTREIFDKKLEYKGIKFKGIVEMFSPGKIRAAEAYYQAQLGHQVSSLPAFAELVKQLQTLLLESGQFD